MSTLTQVAWPPLLLALTLLAAPAQAQSVKAAKP